jgi:hypothetical protein
MYMLDPYNTSYNNNTYFVYNALSGITTDPRNTGRPAERANFIASSQGFFVKAKSTINSNSNSNKNMVFRETHKPVSFGAVYPNLRQEGALPQIKIALSEGATQNIGQTVVAFSPDATDGYDDYDARPFSGTAGIYTILGDGSKLSINTLQWPREEVNVPLVVNPDAPSGAKSFTITTMTATGFNYFLYDDYLGTSTLIVQGAVIPFEFTGNLASRSTDRFRIVTTPLTTGNIEVKPEVQTDVESTGMVLSPNPNTTGELDLLLYGAKAGGTAEVEILDSRGIVVYKTVGVQTRKTSFGADAHLEFGHLPAGVYAVRCTHAGGTSTKKMVVNK